VKINNKGFTLVELLATIIILGLISTVAIVTLTDYFQESEEKSEEVFIKQIKGYVDDYIALYGSSSFSNPTNNGIKNKCHSQNDQEVCDSVSVFKANNNPNFDLISSSIASKELINPVTEVVCNNSNTNITIYRDTDFVYCFTIEPIGTNSCLSSTINTCKELYKNW